MTTTSTPSTGFSRVRMDSSTQECMTSAPQRFDRTEHGPVQGLSRGQISNRFVDLSLVNQSQEFHIALSMLWNFISFLDAIFIGFFILSGFYFDFILILFLNFNIIFDFKFDF